MNKIERLSAILIQLQSKSVVRAQDIAERYGVSLRTVYRDINTLSEAGVPIAGEVGVGYSLADGYKLPPVMFTEEEAVALLTAEKLVSHWTDRGTSAVFESAMTKIRATLRSSEKDHLNKVDEQIQVLSNPFFPKEYNSTSSAFLHTILKAVQKQQLLLLDYRGVNDTDSKQREVEPIGCFLSFNKWYLLAFCRTRSAIRQFRLDRIENVRNLFLTFDTVHPTIEEYFATRITEDQQLVQEVKLVWKTTDVPYISEQKYYLGYVSEEEENEFTTFTFLTTSLCGFARWLLMIGENIHAIHPLELAQEYDALLKRMVDNRKKSM